MKQLINQKILFVALSFLMLPGCGDDDDVKSKGQFTLDEDATEIASGYFVYDISPNTDDDENTYYRNQLIFLGKGLSIEGFGEGNVLELLINNEDQELQTGTYTWQAEGNEQPFDLWSGELTLNVNTENEASYRLVSGDVVVSKSGSTYKISFSGTAYLDVDDDSFRNHAGLPTFPVTAQFEGKLNRISFDF